MNGEKPGIALVPDEDEESEDTIPVTQHGGGGGYWGMIGWLAGLGSAIAAGLAVTAGFWGLFLLARLLWNSMGL